MESIIRPCALLYLSFASGLAAVPSAVCQAHVTNVVTLSNENPPVPATLILPPASAQDGMLVGGAYVWEEQNDITLGAALPVDVLGFGNGIPGGYQTAFSPLNPGTIPAGTKVSSFIMHFDTINNATDDIASFEVFTDEDIIGVIYTDATLNLTDPLIGAATVYPTNLAFRGTADDPLEGQDHFVVGVPSDLDVGYSRSIFVFSMEVQGGLDEVRIITAPHVAPEPASAALAVGCAMPLLLARRRRRP